MSFRDANDQPWLPWWIRYPLYPIALIGLGCLLLGECLCI